MTLDAFKEHGDAIWNIPDLLSGPYRSPQYRQVIARKVFRRLNCVLEGTKDSYIKLHGDLKAETRVKDGETVPKHEYAMIFGVALGTLKKKEDIGAFTAMTTL